MDVRVRIGHGKDFHDNEDKLVEFRFESYDDAMETVDFAVTQGYVVKIGVGDLDE